MFQKFAIRLSLVCSFTFGLGYLTASLKAGEYIYPSCAAPAPIPIHPPYEDPRLIPSEPTPIEKLDKDGNEIEDKFQGKRLPKENLDAKKLQDNLTPPAIAEKPVK